MLHNLLCASTLPIAVCIAAAPGARASAAHRVGPDFNGDGYTDLAIGVPDEDVNGFFDAGLVHVLYGSPNGLKTQNDQVWTLDTSGINGACAELGLLGVALTWGDFDGDGFDDLAIGALGEDVDGVNFAGAVHVLYGSHQGLRASGDQRWTQNSPGIANDAEDSDQFGNAVAAADFNGDGFDDLAIGVHWQDINGAVDAGAVHVLYGSPNGLTSDGSQLWHQNRTGILGDAEANDSFGAALATGDFNDDGFADLAIGVPGKTVGGSGGAGGVQILYGSHHGLHAAHNQFWTQDSPGIMNAAAAGDGFGTALASGDFDGDGKDDLAIGVPGEDGGAGAVAILYGSTLGLRARDQFWTENSSGLNDAAEAGDNFGATLAVGDFDNDGRDDLAIGIRNKTVDGAAQAGAVRVLYGFHHTGLRATGTQLLSQNTPGIPDVAEEQDKFGYSLATGDFDGDGRADLAIGVPYEDFDGLLNPGLIHILFGSNSGISTGGDQVFTQDTPGIGDDAEAGDEFGDYM